MLIIDGLIREKGIEQKEFCNAIGVLPQVFSDWKSGRNKSFHKHLSKIADYFGVSVDYLLGTEAQKNPAISKDGEINENPKIIKLHELMKTLSPDELDRFYSAAFALFGEQEK
jgi:transcriptional regulator with XRE-family HTH domain